MASREGRPRSNEFRLPHVRSIFLMSFRSVPNEDRVGVKLTYLACADYTEVTTPHNMWHKHSMLRENSGISLGSPIPQSGSKNTRINDAIDIDQISDDMIEAQEKGNPRLEREEHVIKKVVLLHAKPGRANKPSKIILNKTCIVMV